MNLTGGCMCGRVRYASDSKPFHQTICHCADCRRAVGAASVAWFSVPRSTLRFTAGEPSAFRSSPGVVRRFCAACGTSLTFESDAATGEVDITICSLDDPASMPPRDHTWAASRLPWDVPGDELPAFKTTRSA